MKSIVFDTSTVISLVTNNLLWVTAKLKEQFNGHFVIPKSVEHELIGHPLKTRRFKLEAIVINDYVEEGIFKLHSSAAIKETTHKLLSLANNIFIAKNNPIRILQQGEVEAIALALHLKSDALAVDERTLRLLIENPEKNHKILERKMHTKIIVNKENLNEFQRLTKGIKILRSTELVTVAYDMGLLNKYITAKKQLHRELRKPLLEGALWGLKLHGCSISESEINDILKLRFRR
jgi:hypothetical protein